MIADLAHNVGWSLNEISRRLDVSERTVRRWASGETPAPARIVEWLLAVERAIDRVPFPDK